MGQKILDIKNIKINLPSVGKEEAIKAAGQLLVDGGYVQKNYIEYMLQREKECKTSIGNYVAIPHGIAKSKEEIKKSGIVVLQYPEGIDYDGDLVKLVIGIAGKNDEHLEILGNIAEIISDQEKVEKLVQTNDVEEIYHSFV